MTRATPDKFQFSVKDPETVTHDKRRDVSKGAMALLDEFLEKISPLKSVNKLEQYLFNCRQVSLLKNFRIQKNFLTDFLVDMIMPLNLGIPLGIPKDHGSC